MTPIKRISLCLLSVVLPLASFEAFADDPPGRVGRLSYTEGTVSFHAPDTGDWSFVPLNYPVTSGDSFWTDTDGRSEIQFGAIDVRMDNLTELSVVELDDSASRLEVPQGALNVHVSAVPIGGSVEVMTPNGIVSLVQPGTYHIDSGHPIGDQPSGQTSVTTLEGQLQINGPRSLVEVMPGETAVLNGNPPSFNLQEGNPTAFDDWALMLEKREAVQHGPTYVSPYMTGAADLGRFGQWSTTPHDGPVWYPAAVAANWAPYRYGHWAFVTPWGWTWVDDAPWGFAPFHYGRWAEFNGRWGWAPGAVAERPVYAPALVAFVGGRGWNISMAGGNNGPAIGWVPLAPREVFHPYYPVSVDYARHVNVGNVERTEISNITVNNYKTVEINNYANHQAATVVPAQSFTTGAPVHQAIVPVSAQQLSHAPASPQAISQIKPAPQARSAGGALPQKERADVPKGELPMAAHASGSGMNAPPVHPSHPQAEGLPEARRPEQTPAPSAPTAGIPVPQPTPSPEVKPGTAFKAPEHMEGQNPAERSKAEPTVPPANPVTSSGAAVNNRAEVKPAEAKVASTPPMHATVPPPHHATMPTWNKEEKPPVAEQAAKPAANPASQPVSQASRPMTNPPAAVAMKPIEAKKEIAPVQHPAQSTHIAPTPQGWQRVPAPKDEHAGKPGEPTHPPEKSDPHKTDEHKPNDQPQKQ